MSSYQKSQRETNKRGCERIGSWGNRWRGGEEEKIDGKIIKAKSDKKGGELKLLSESKG